RSITPTLYRIERAYSVSPATTVCCVGFIVSIETGLVLFWSVLFFSTTSSTLVVVVSPFEVGVTTTDAETSFEILAVTGSGVTAQLKNSSCSTSTAAACISFVCTRLADVNNTVVPTGNSFTDKVGL